MKSLAIAVCLVIALCGSAAAKAADVTATITCGKSEQQTPCALILNRTVMKYRLLIKKDGTSTLFNPRILDLGKDICPQGSDALFIRTVEVKP